MKAENVIIEKIYPAKEGKNPNFSTLQLRVTEKVKNHLNVLLDSEGFDKTKVAFQTVANTTIAKFGLQEGDNLGAKLGIDYRISHVETLEPGLPGFQAMINPENQAAVTAGGSQIYFKRELSPVQGGSSDVYLDRDSATVAAASNIASSVEEA
jgi:hypothetical protein